LTGDPTTDTSNAIVPFSSPTFYPQTQWNPNYYSTLINGGDTELAVTPVQYESGPGGVATDIQRTYNNLDLNLFYEPNPTSGTVASPPVADPPTISDVTGTTSGGDVVTVSANVTADPSTSVQEVWVTFTGSSGPLYGTWQSELLSLSPSGPGSTVWTGTYLDTGGNPTTDSLFMVQAVDGTGLVSVDNNNGSYFTPTAGVTPPPQPVSLNTYELSLSGASGGTTGGTALVSATLASTGGPSHSTSGDAIVFSLGGTTVGATTITGGTATATLPLNGPPGSYTLTASYAGDASDAPTAASEPFVISKIATALSLSVPASGQFPFDEDNGVSATLSTSVGGVPLSQKTLYFVYSNQNGPVAAAAGITNDQGVAQAGLLSLPPGLVTYGVTAYFGSSAVPLPGLSGGYNASDPDFGPST